MEGLLMMCTDENVQQCHPIIAGMSVDYKEQVVITGIKSGMQCSMCQVPPNERENLCKKWPKRTNERILSQLALQDIEDWIEENSLRHSDCVYSIRNFAWNHSFVNIHECMMLDILHQLLKRVVGGTHMFQWLKTVIGAKFKGARVKAGATRSLQQANGTVLLDERFCAVLSYPTLKIFKEYSKVKQWDRSEYWAACRQLVPVVTPLLIKDDPTVFQCMRAIIDFAHMAQYKSHINETV